MDALSFYLQFANVFFWAFLFVIWKTEDWVNIVLRMLWLVLFVLDLIHLIQMVK